MTEEIKEPKEYEATFKLLMPSNVKESEYKINVKALDQVQAMEAAIVAWDAAVEPRNIQIKEVQKK